MEIVYLLQRHTLNLIHRFLCGGDHVASSPERKRLVTRYLNAVTDMRMVILARSRWRPNVVPVVLPLLPVLGSARYG